MTLLIRLIVSFAQMDMKWTPCDGGIRFETEAGIFGNQVIPTILVISGMWIVLVPQIWGLIHQSKLDDKALAIAEKVVYESKYEKERK